MVCVSDGMRGKDDHNRLALGLGTFGHIHCHLECRSAGRPDHKSFHCSKLSYPRNSLFGAAARKLTHMTPRTRTERLVRSQIGEEVGRNSCANAQNAVGRMRLTEMDTRFGGLHTNNLTVGIHVGQILASASCRSAGADASNKKVDLLSRLFPDFRTGRLIVNCRIGLIVELIRKEVGIIPLYKFFHVILQTRQALGRRTEIHVRPEHSTYNVAFLEGGDLGHGNDALVAFGRTHHG
mmetsp:Transcript_21983/g.63041  ORF Transcript_21983/g.63041 Transcript_21983/m.63041 type:complete len:237 (+) Transcript_21983:158-868(+)